MTDATPVPEELAAHAAFVRALAHALLRDPNDAEDVAQQTLWTALAHPAEHGADLRGWLVRVVHNLAFRRRRGAARRSHHERAGARDEALPAIDESVARQEMLQFVVTAVLELDEPYRDAVLARFYEGIPPRAIAERLGVPVETVHTRLSRAKAQLQSKLQTRERDWRLSLVLLTGRSVCLPGGEGALGSRRGLWQVGMALLATAMLFLGWRAWDASSLRDSPALTSLHGSMQPFEGTQINGSPDQTTSSQREPVMPTAIVLASALSILAPSQESGPVRLVSIGFDPTTGLPAVGNGESNSACLSANGRYVAFSSKATNILPPGPTQDTNLFEDVFVRDLLAERTYLVSTPPGFPVVQADGPSKNPAITPDGRFVVFDSAATNLVPGDTNGVSDIFRVDLLALPGAPTPELVSLSDSEVLGNGLSIQPVVSDDGNIVAFTSTATNLTSDSATSFAEIFVRDLIAGSTIAREQKHSGNAR